MDVRDGDLAWNRRLAVVALWRANAGTEPDEKLHHLVRVGRRELDTDAGHRLADLRASGREGAPKHGLRDTAYVARGRARPDIARVGHRDATVGDSPTVVALRQRVSNVTIDALDERVAGLVD